MQRTDYGRIAVLIVLVIVLYYVFRILEPFLPALAWAAILASVFHPLFSALSRRLRRPRLASALSCFLLTVVIVLHSPSALTGCLKRVSGLAVPGILKLSEKHPLTSGCL
jgi:predicted PurR-regulated permease PerM